MADTGPGIYDSINFLSLYSLSIELNTTLPIPPKSSFVCLLLYLSKLLKLFSNAYLAFKNFSIFWTSTLFTVNVTLSFCISTLDLSSGITFVSY